MTDTKPTRQINTPEAIQLRSGLDIPQLLLPDPARVFADRALRLRQQAAGHAMRDYLMLMAVVCEAQHQRLRHYPAVPLPTPAQIGTQMGFPSKRRHEVPPVAQMKPSSGWKEQRSR